ncbi:hypothetical protein WN55_03458 [Dufourea novaeangliae]|uniref:Uncharacterized protein n=1 Tax=Dufourea novaeangliae TaxID=178035 RepID=A0A154PKF5_DUFNO|nr:hypothetical protein WN55_03458 [Dufourea novaeangliae]
MILCHVYLYTTQPPAMIDLSINTKKGHKKRSINTRSIIEKPHSQLWLVEKDCY